MTDSTLNRFLSAGTTAERGAFTPDPPTPASGPDPSYLWWDTDDQALYAYDFGLADWVVTGGGGSGTVSSVATGVGLTGGPVTTTGTISVIIPTKPNGRLTLTSGTPVLTAGVTGQTTVYYALYDGNYVPIYDGTNFVPTAFTELSQATTDNTKSPAACAAHSNYDLFVWNDSGTIRCTRGPAWTQAQTFTVTIATPGVFSCTGHGFYEGMPIILSTNGALPTGLSVATTYFVIAAGLTANAFQVSATEGGAAINTTGSQSGTHTVTQNSTVRGSGAGTTEIARVNGIWLNANNISNGPAANRGTYVGTIRTNGSSQIDHILGGTGAAGGESSVLGVWNAYNRRPVTIKNYDNTDTWNYTTGTWRAKNGNVANKIKFVIGLLEDFIQALNSTVSSNSSSGISQRSAIGLNSTTAYHLDCATANYGLGINVPGTGVSNLKIPGPLGFNGVVPLEHADASGTCTWRGDGGGTTINAMFHCDLWA